MLVDLIWGTTCSGKTSAAVDLATQTGAPVISVDRIQCYPEIATGSGRPLPEELKNTHREYIVERSLSQGIITAHEAHDILKKRTSRYREQGVERLILEGGSISLLSLLMKDFWWSEGFLWNSIRMPFYAEDAFLRRAEKRVGEMLTPGPDKPSLLQELVTAWPDPKKRDAISDIDGYRYTLKWCKEHERPISKLLDLDDNQKRELVSGIAREYLEHAHWQQRDFPSFPESWDKWAP